MFFRETEGGIELFVRLTPRGGSDCIGGVKRASDGREYLAARVRAVAEKGAASAALAALMAKAAGLPKNAASAVARHASRLKTVRLEGDAAGLSARLTELAREPIGGKGKRR